MAVIDAFRGARRSFLMPPATVVLTGTSVIDISHESLMRNWLQLKDWINEEDQSATIYRRLAETTELYEQKKANYWRDPELTNGLLWFREQKPNAVWAERYASNFDEAIAFLQASANDREEEALNKERAKKREINRLRSFLVLLGGLSLLTGSAAVYAIGQQQEAKRQEATAIQNEAVARKEKDNAEQQRAIADEQRVKAQQQEKIALDEKGRAENAQKEAEEQKQQAEEAQKAEVEQRQLAEGALQRAEEGEGEANRQAGIAREQTVIANQQTEIAQDNALRAETATAEAKREKERAEVQTLNAEIQAESLTIENLMASDLNFKALLKAMALGKQIQISRGRTPFQRVQTKGNSKAVNSNTAFYPNSIQPEIALQSVSVLREAYYLPGFLEKNTFLGHVERVWSVSFSPDGQTIASAGADNTVKLWDTQGRELQTLQGHTNWVLSVSFSPDGQTIASAGADNTVKLWDTQGRELQTLQGHTNWVRSVSFSPDGQTIASASADNTVKLWDTQGRELQTLQGHTGRGLSVSFSPDGQTIASASDDGTVKLWGIQGRELQTLQGHTGRVWSVSFSPDGQTIASGSFDGTIKLWDTQGRELQTLEGGHTGNIRSVSFSPDGQTIASASDDGTVKLWDFDLNKLIARSCDWLSDYMANPATPPEDKALCKDVLLPSQVSAAPTQLSLALQLQGFWSWHTSLVERVKRA